MTIGLRLSCKPASTAWRSWWRRSGNDLDLPRAPDPIQGDSRWATDRQGPETAVANVLVDWFNAVDLTYGSELRELNELNYAGFEAKR